MNNWKEGDFYEVTYAVSDLLFGGELAYESYAPQEFLQVMRRNWLSDRESASNLMRENAELKAFRSAVVGWREVDTPEGMCRGTAEFIANLGIDAESLERAKKQDRK